MDSDHRARSLNISHREIVVGLDDSRSARSGLHWAADYARRTRLRLRAVHVLSWPLGVSAPGYDGKDAVGHPSFEEVDAIYRASITAVSTSSTAPGRTG
jgi:nucleotide-binding universal stress UspA family protein